MLAAIELVGNLAMVKIVKFGVIGLVSVAVLMFVMEIVASESAEVVVLTTAAEDGPKETRLWVVDRDGTQYLRAQPGSGWYARLVATPEVRFERRGLTGRFRAVANPESSGEINRLMREKYGWRDAYISWLLGSREEAIAVELVPFSSSERSG
jgi:hypothetical protein